MNNVPFYMVPVPPLHYGTLDTALFLLGVGECKHSIIIKTFVHLVNFHFTPVVGIPLAAGSMARPVAKTAGDRISVNIAV